MINKLKNRCLVDWKLGINTYSTSGLVCGNASTGHQDNIINPDFSSMTVDGFGIGTGTLVPGQGQIAA